MWDILAPAITPSLSPPVCDIGDRGRPCEYLRPLHLVAERQSCSVLPRGSGDHCSHGVSVAARVLCAGRDAGHWVLARWCDRWHAGRWRACPWSARLPAVPASPFLRQVEQLLELLTTEILHPDSQAPNGVKSHFLEIFLEELSKVGADEVGAAGRERVASSALGVCTSRWGSPISLPVADSRPEPEVHRSLLQDRCPD